MPKHQVAAELAPLLRSVADLQPHPQNPNIGDVAAIAVSLAENSQYRPIVVQASTGYILAGNHTWKAAQSLGWDKIAAVTVDVNDDTALRILAVDNRSAQLAYYDDMALLELLNTIDALPRGLLGTGWMDDDLQALRDLNTPAPTAEELEGKHQANAEDPSFNPRIDLAVTAELMDSWRLALDAHTGDDDTEKLAGLLAEVLTCRGGDWTRRT